LLPQFSAIPLQSTEASSDSAKNLNQLLPVGKNVSATVIAVSRDQVQPEIFRLKLEINNRLIQMGVFQALPVGQKINVNRQSDGQIQITPQANPNAATQTSDKAAAPSQTITNQPTVSGQRNANVIDANIKLQFLLPAVANKIPDTGRLLAAVISSRPIYPASVFNPQNAAPQPAPQNTTTGAATQTPQAPQTANTTIQTPSANPTSTQPNLTAAETRAAISSAINTTTSSAANPNSQVANTATTSTTVPSQTPAATDKTSTAATNAPVAPTPLKTQASTTPTDGQAYTAIGTAKQSSVTPPGSTISNPSQAVSNPANPNIGTASAQVANEANPVAQSVAAATANAARITPPPSHHAVTLTLPDGSKIEFNSPQPLPQGAQVLLQKTGAQDALIVKIQLPNLAPSSALERPAIQEILRNNLPLQIPTGDVFAQLAQTAAATQGAQAAQVSSVVKSMLQLFGVRPGSQEAPSQIRQNIELGGMHTERYLSEGKAPNPQDMKSQLQQLQNLVDRLPMEQRERFEQLLRGLHSRVTSQQLTSLQQWRELPDGGFERVLQFDLPVKQGDRWENLELRLSREGGSNAAGEMVSVWRVRLHFDLDDLGGVDAEIRLSDEHEISTFFWCDKKETAEKLRNKADDFAGRLRECGFSNSEVQWHEGKAPEQKQSIHKKLVDLHT